MLESTNVCMYYDCFTDTWVPVTDIPAKLLCHRGNVIKHKGRDYKWLIAGGLSEYLILKNVCEYTKYNLMLMINNQTKF